MSLFLLIISFYLTATLNLSLLTHMVERGDLSSDFWTRSIRSVLIVPPLAILVFFLHPNSEGAIFSWIRKSLDSNCKTVFNILKKR